MVTGFAASAVLLLASPGDGTAAPSGQEVEVHEEKDGKPTGVVVGASVYAVLGLRAEQTLGQVLDLDRARLSARLTPASWLWALIELDALQVPSVKDAFVHAGAGRPFALVAGRFKKPFSLIETTPTRALPLISRGIVDEGLVRALGLGGRDLGVMVAGGGGRLRYALGAFNSSQGSSDAEDSRAGRDGTARLELRASDALAFGLSGTVQAQPAGAASSRPIWGAGLDARWRTGPVRWRAETIGAIQPLDQANRRAAGGILYGYVSVPLGGQLALQPVIKGEALDDDLFARGDESWAALAGCNLNIGRSLRVLLQGEAIGAGPHSVIRSSRSLLVELAFDDALRLGSANIEEREP
jgi:hypothetical protein